MATPVAKKLRIRENDTLLALHAPAELARSLQPLPAGVTIITSGKKYDQVHWFVLNKARVEKEMSKVLQLIKPATILWIYYPKGSSRLQTDLTRDKGWEGLLAHGDTLTWISLVSFDDTWSVFGCRLKTEADIKKAIKPKPQREIFNYVDPATKAIRLPDDLAALLKKNKQEAAFFEQLSFTNKKEYIEWIVTAKREETRKQRLAATMEKLAKGWKNPANS